MIYSFQKLRVPWVLKCWVFKFQKELKLARKRLLEVKNMTYKPVFSHNDIRREVLDDPEAKAIYDATKMQIEIAIKLKQDGIEKLIGMKKQDAS